MLDVNKTITLREVIKKVDNNGEHSPYKLYNVIALKDLLASSILIDITKTYVYSGEYVDLIWQDVFATYSEYYIKSNYISHLILNYCDYNVVKEECERFLTRIVKVIQESYEKYSVLIKAKIKDTDLNSIITSTTSNQLRRATTTGVVPVDGKFQDDGSADSFADKKVVTEHKNSKDFNKLSFLHNTSDILKEWRLLYFDKFFTNKNTDKDPELHVTIGYPTGVI